MDNYLCIMLKFIVRENKRTLLKCCSIFLSSLLITAIFFIVINIKNSQIEQAKKVSGDYHVEIRNINVNKINVLKNHINVDEIGIKKELVTSQLTQNMIFVDIGYYDENALKMLNAQIIKGRLPKNENEIVLEESVVKRLCLDEKLDQIVCLFFPKQKYVTQYGGISEREMSIYYKLVGILKDRPQEKVTINTLGLVSADSIDNFNLADINYDIYVRIKDNLSIYNAIDEIKNDLNISKKDIYYNTELINKVNVDVYKNTHLIVCLIAILVASGLMLNIFNISDIGTFRKIGLLYSIGMTYKQIRRIFLIEILILSMMSIPFGVLVGTEISKLLVVKLLHFQNGISCVKIDGRFIGISVVASFVSIMLAIIIPIIKIRSYSIADLLKLNMCIEEHKYYDEKTIKNSVMNLFGINTKIAYRNVWRNRRRAILTIVSLSSAIMLFIMISSVCYSFNPIEIARKYNVSDYIIKGFENTGYLMNDYSKIASLKGVEKIYRTHMDTIYVKVKVSNNFKGESEVNTFEYKRINRHNQYTLFKGNLYGYTNETLKLAKDDIISGYINIDNMKNSNIVIMVKDDYSNDLDLKVGDDIVILNNDKKLKCKIGAIVSYLPIRILGESNGPSFVVHENIYSKFIGAKTYSQFNIDIIDDADKQTLEVLSNNFNSIAHNITDGSVVSFREEIKKYEGYKRQINILFLSLMTIIIGVGIFSIMNTVNINMTLRIKEFALFRTYGMTKGQLRKTVIMEGIIYGVFSSFWGTVMGVIFSKIVFIFMSKYFPYVPWSIWLKSIVYACIGCVSLSILSSIIPLINFHKVRVVDVIRNDR
ncbi:outer membrane-specific lipoprotein transporter subunit LolE [Clostridium tepidiprofundi DSM 19306]|uniref:Outer membrane-specific lipoprotein transporter subunit LolE n=1 Tax=Clostridium tepidiprofundi DSM 19306 TaxID=1121338 RepID=A0A151B4L3_9CLOT|nr:FtsX-like permease family protein [Clostridium tepidiprofundi]KYH34861.1 outer membrane-specific lipoprotein transporter subunit LolE [Clostridium tepidiprofundi DSM 19306]